MNRKCGTKIICRCGESENDVCDGRADDESFYRAVIRSVIGVMVGKMMSKLAFRQMKRFLFAGKNNDNLSRSYISLLFQLQFYY